MKLKSMFLAIISITMLFLACSEDPDARVVARIGNESITAGELQAKLKEIYYNKPLHNITEQEKKDALEKLLDDYRKTIWAKEKGLDQDLEFQTVSLYNKARLVATAFYDEKIVDGMISPALLDQYFQWNQTNIELAVITVGSNQSEQVENARTLEEALEVANKHKAELAASNNPTGAASRLNEFRFGQGHHNPYKLGTFGASVDSLIYQAKVGDMIGPYNLNGAYLVIRVLSRQPTTNKNPKQSSKAGIKRMLRGKMRGTEQELFKKYTEEFIAKYNGQFHDDQIEIFAREIQQWGATSNGDVSTFTDEARGRTLGSIGEQKITSGDLLTIYKQNLRKDFVHFAEPEKLRDNFVKQQMNLFAWYLDGKANGADEKSDVKMKVARDVSGRLAQQIENYLGKQIEISDAQVAAFYNENKKNYFQPEAIEIWQIGSTSEDKVKDILRQAKNGSDFSELNRNNRGNLRGKKGKFSLGFQPRESTHIPEIIQLAYEVGPNQFGGPVKIGSEYFIVKTGNLRPEYTRPLEEVAVSIHSELLNREKSKLRNELLDNIRNDYAFRINESVLRSIG